MQSCSIVQSQFYIGKWVYMGRVFAAAVIHCISSQKAYNVRVKQYANCFCITCQTVGILRNMFLWVSSKSILENNSQSCVWILTWCVCLSISQDVLALLILPFGIISSLRETNVGQTFLFIPIVKVLENVRCISPCEPNVDHLNNLLWVNIECSHEYLLTL